MEVKCSGCGKTFGTSAGCAGEPSTLCLDCYVVTPNPFPGREGPGRSYLVVDGGHPTWKFDPNPGPDFRELVDLDEDKAAAKAAAEGATK